jgi:ketosteroid isomerase-like protein
MTENDARAFAARWIDDWNSHDLDRILAHYAEDIVFLSPYARKLVGAGRVEGKAALRAYWAKGLAALPDLKFTLVATLVGDEALTILYTNQRGQRVAETCEFGAAGQVTRSYGCYE